MSERYPALEPDRLPKRLPARPPAPSPVSSPALPPGPDPGGATTPEEFVERLRAAKVWSGDPSLRELERRTGLPRSTLSGDLSPRRNRLPPLERVLVLATTFGVPAEELGCWRAAWQRIQLRQQSAGVAAPAAPEGEPAGAGATPPASGLVPGLVPEVVRGPAPRTAGEAVGPELRRSARRPSARRPSVRRRFSRRPSARRRLWTALSVGGLLGALLVLPPAVAQVDDGSGVAAGDRSASPVGARVPDPCGFLGRVGGTPEPSPPDAAATTGESLRLRGPVAQGETLIVTLVLGRAGSGPITVRDTAGNRYRAIRDETTDGTRLTVFALYDARPLDALDQITFLWPSSKRDYTEVDEFRGTRSAVPTGDLPVGGPAVAAVAAGQC
ncbi:hypothetical protein ACIQ9P_26040 [Kitasatospora sp. NPDC094019]|uniref:helix-turn-helix domain-containing protein n=1 Tax=Kitasatospora sp. NPDC094019 TaxID=3364091 RepID=UPI00381627A9